MTKKNEYNAEQIKTLDGISHIRLRPGMYCGSVSIDGLHHILLEIISNSIDEYLMGYGNKIEVILDKDNYIQVNDNARGVPHGVHSSGCSVLQAVFGIANTGGKYDDSGQSGYNSSGGQNGIGSKATNALSSNFMAASTRNGVTEIVTFKKGEFVNFQKQKADKNLSGTSVRFQPDDSIFEVVEINLTRLKIQLQELSFLCRGLEINLIDRRKEKIVKEVFKSTKGLLDYLPYLNKDKDILTKPFYLDASDSSPGLELAFMYNKSYSDTYKLYTNNIPNSQGTHITGFRSALVRCVNDFGKKHGIIKDKEPNLVTDDLKEGLVVVLNLKMSNPVYQGQTKENLTSSEGRTLTDSLVKAELLKWLEGNPEEGKKIIEKAMLSRRAKDAAKKAREAARKTPSSGQTIRMPGKLSDCIGTKVEDTEIYLVEGK